MKRCKLLILLGLCCFIISCSAEINVTTCEINVKQGNTDIPCETGYFDFGNIPLNYSQTITFTIENTGVADLELTSVDKVQVLGQNADEFELILDLTDSLILPEGNTEFSVKFNPKSMGNKTATISIPNNDKNENPYTFVIVGNCTPPAPEMHVVQNTQDILCSTGVFNFGIVAVNTSSDKVTFTIQNNGDEDLDLTGNPDIISKSGVNADLFTIDQTNTISPVSSGSSTTFDITFKPTSPGVKTAKISILNNDSDENPYTFTITGTSVNAPEINIKQGATDIPNGTGEFDFSDTLINESSPDVIFTIENLGTAKLHLNDKPDYVKISGTDAAMFSVNLSSTDEDIAPGNSTSFKLSFSPNQLGDKSATISISSNDNDEDPYIFTVKGKVLQPEINIMQGSDIILSSTGSFDMGGVIVNSSGPEIEFTIENLGDGDLKLTGSPIVEFTGANASEFSANTSSTLTTINPNSDTIVKIQCNPTSKGNKTVTVSIANNDLDENPYTFTIKAYGSIYTEGDVNGDGIADVIVGAYENNSGGSDSGKSYIFFGKSNWNSSYDASVADVKLIGEKSNDHFGCSVSMAGDLNSDGFEDVIVGAYFVTDAGYRKGGAYIFFGRLNWSSSIDASDADVKIIGESEQSFFGHFLSTKGDINKDGLDDLIITAPLDSDGGNNSGCAFVFFGRSNWGSVVYASNADIKIIGEDAGDMLGLGVSISGDVNNDGINDIVIDASSDDDGGTDAGAVYIFFGKQNWSSSVDASTADVKLIGEDSEDWFGRSISCEGDINNDGIDDVVVGAYQDDDGGDYSGCVFIFFGRTNWANIIDASTANVKILGSHAGDFLGYCVSTSNDINGDGLNDLIIGATFSNGVTSNTGCSYIFFGKQNWSSSMNDTNSDIQFKGVNQLDMFGYQVSLINDINNDGYSDVIIGSIGVDEGGSEAGCVYIFYGRQNWNSSYEASNADVKIIGENAGDKFGYSVSPN